MQCILIDALSQDKCYQRRHVFLHFIWPCFGLWATTVSGFEIRLGWAKLRHLHLLNYHLCQQSPVILWHLTTPGTKTSLCFKSVIIVWKLGSLRVPLLKHSSRLFSFFSPGLVVSKDKKRFIATRRNSLYLASCFGVGSKNA